MRRALEAGLGWVWRASTPAAVAAGMVLAPLEMAFAAAITARNRRYDTGRLPVRSVGVPVVSVGNLAVGGSGKTPVSAWLAAWFLRRGVVPGVVTNGYAADEVLLHRRWNPGAPVAAHRQRARAAAAVVEQGAQAVILDDGFQHRALARDLELVVVAAEHPTPVRLLPRGPYREPEGALARADGVIVTRRTASFRTARRRVDALAAHGPRSVLIRLRASRWRDLAGAPVPEPKGAVLVLAGIANPREFRGLLERRCPEMEMESMNFRDHHAYSAADVAAIARRARGRPVVTTAKDAVKLERLGEHGVDARVLHLEVVVERGLRWLEGALGQLPGMGTEMTTKTTSPGAGAVAEGLEEEGGTETAGSPSPPRGGRARPRIVGGTTR